MGDLFSSAIVQIIAAITSLVVLGIGTIGGFYVKRLDSKLKMKTLTDEINRYVAWADQANSFKAMSNMDKRDTVLERIRQFAADNEIAITDAQLILMVERSVQSLRSLEDIGIKMKMRHYDSL